jgi:hypothetical protein
MTAILSTSERAPAVSLEILSAGRTSALVLINILPAAVPVLIQGRGAGPD